MALHLVGENVMEKMATWASKPRMSWDGILCLFQFGMRNWDTCAVFEKRESEPVMEMSPVSVLLNISWHAVCNFLRF